MMAPGSLAFAAGLTPPRLRPPASADRPVPTPCLESGFGRSLPSNASPRGGGYTDFLRGRAGAGAALVVALALGLRQRAREVACGVRAARGGPSAPVKRRQKRERRLRLDEAAEARRFKLDPNRPPPANASGAPKSGAWQDGRPESESLRQGEYRSPYTGQVYDRWAPIGLKQTGTDRQGGLGRARAYETPMQRQIREALNPDDDNIPEWQKYYPGLAPKHLMPRQNPPKPLLRHATRAGGFADVFNQLVVHTIVDLKVNKSEKPVWYVETCSGEGEYHVSRMRKPGDELAGVLEPTSEQVFEVLDSQDLTYMPPELRAWVSTMRLINRPDEAFEVKGPGAEGPPPRHGVQWLPSTALVAAQLLRKQDPVTLFEDNPDAFGILANFIRNYSDRVAPHMECRFWDGFQAMEYMFVKKKIPSKAHGVLAGQRGIVFADPDYARGAEAWRLKDLIHKMRKHWRAATVIATYPLSPTFEQKVRKFCREVQEEDSTLDLLLAEMYVDTPNWDPESTLKKWHGCGVLISSPPYTAGERIRAAVGVMCQELAKRPNASEMRVRVEELK